MAPAVSVVIPTHNNAPYLREALESVFAQTYTDYEIIVVDDGSIDDTRQRLAPYTDKGRIKYVCQEHTGVSAARNHGVRLAQGMYVAFLDADDLFLPTKLEKQMTVFAEVPDLGFVHCSFSKFDTHGNDLGVRDTSRFQGWIYPQMLREWSILMAMPCMLMKTDAVRKAGGFDEGMGWAEDLDLWRRVARLYPVGTVPEALVRVRVHSSSTTFVRRGGAEGFERYLEKAFAEDTALSESFKRRATADMHTKLGQNLLGEGGSGEMSEVRKHSQTALAAWPLQWGAWAAWLASFLPHGIRRALVGRLRTMRYPKASSE